MFPVLYKVNLQESGISESIIAHPAACIQLCEKKILP